MSAISMIRIGFLLCFVVTTSAFAEEPAVGGDESAPTSVVPSTPSAAVSQAETSAPAGDDRNEALTVALRDLVKKMDTADRNGRTFPAKSIETAIRSEFMRRAEGDNSISWMPKKNVREADTAIAQDNLGLFISYAKHLLNATKANKKLGKKEEEQMRLMAAKAVIDETNGVSKSTDRTIASTSTSIGLGKVGKGELQRRRALKGGLVSGEDYRPLGAKSVDDIGKAYKAVLGGAVKQYFAMAEAINKASAKRK